MFTSSEIIFSIDDNDPVKLIHHNNTLRQHSGIIHIEGLYTLDEVNTNHILYDYKYPTLIHKNHEEKLNKQLICQVEYSSILNQEYPFIDTLLSIVPGLVLAGGAALWPFTSRVKKPKDLDFFLYGDLNPFCQWSRLEATISIIMNAYKKRIITQEMTNGLCTLIIHDNNIYSKKNLQKYNTETLQIQIILRNYTSISQLLHGFDISASSIAYDGTYTYFTKLGAWSYLTNLIVVWPEYRSSSYESRLVKYWNKGYGIVFPHMLEFSSNMELPHLLINIEYYSGNFAYGNIFLEDNKKQSDYSNDQIQFKSIHELHELNTLQIIQNSNIYKVSGRYYPGHPSTESTINFKTLRSCVNITQLVPIVKFKQIIEQILYKSIHIKNRKIFIDFYILQNIFKFDHNQIIKFIELATEYNKLLIDNPFQKYNLNYNKFQPKITEFIEKYEISANTEINWWIPFNQNIPFTGALNPIMEEPADWYGKVPITSIDNRIPALNSNSNNYNHNNDILCSCCFVPIMHNDLNIIKLQCGHIFHYLEDIEHSCIGVKKWINAHNECPNCRCKIYFQNEIFDLNI